MGLDVRDSTVQHVKTLAAVKWQLLDAIKAGHEYVQLYICIAPSKGTIWWRFNTFLQCSPVSQNRSVFIYVVQECIEKGAQVQKQDS